MKKVRLTRKPAAAAWPRVRPSWFGFDYTDAAGSEWSTAAAWPGTLSCDSCKGEIHRAFVRWSHAADGEDVLAEYRCRECVILAALSECPACGTLHATGRGLCWPCFHKAGRMELGVEERLAAMRAQGAK